MRKHIISKWLLMAVATVVTACSSDKDELFLPQEAPVPVLFTATDDDATTRANEERMTSPQMVAQAGGFGVFTYYSNGNGATDGAYGSPATTANFMHNQLVTGTNAVDPVWTYTPLKYWPNEFGADAASEGMDRLSFFAYAPYTEVDLVTGFATTNPDYGIIGMTRSAESGYPKVRYVASFDPTKRVDLCWAEPQRNQTKQAVTGKVPFTFNHALAALNVQIDALFDDVAPGGTGTLDANTRIWVRSVTFDGLAVKGELNLNNDNPMPEWNDLYSNSPLNAESVTIYDGRRDGREGYAAMPNEKPIGINAVLVQDGEYTTTASTITAPAIDKGVTKATVNLFEGATDVADPIYVIPTGVPLQITIVYDVETFDPHLVSSYLSDAKTKGVSVENTITKTILIDPADATSKMILDAGFKYTVKLHLGMTSVKADASVTPWDAGDDADTNLPANN